MTIIDYSHNHIANPFGEGIGVSLNFGVSSDAVTIGVTKKLFIYENVFLGSLVDLADLLPQPIPPNTHKVEGQVTNYQGNPVARKVCVFSKTTDQFLGSTVSDSVTGFYSIGFVSPDPVYVVCFPNVDEDINAKIYDRIVPVSV